MVRRALNYWLKWGYLRLLPALKMTCSRTVGGSVWAFVAQLGAGAIKKYYFGFAPKIGRLRSFDQSKRPHNDVSFGRSGLQPCCSCCANASPFLSSWHLTAVYDRSGVAKSSYSGWCLNSSSSGMIGHCVRGDFGGVGSTFGSLFAFGFWAFPDGHLLDWHPLSLGHSDPHCGIVSHLNENAKTTHFKFCDGPFLYSCSLQMMGTEQHQIEFKLLINKNFKFINKYKLTIVKSIYKLKQNVGGGKCKRANCCQKKSVVAW